MSEFQAIIGNDDLQQFGQTLGGVEVDVADVESVLEVREDGFYSEITDASTASIVNAKLSTAAFEHYDVANPPLELGLSWTNLLDFLGKANADTPVQLTYDHETRRLNVDIDSADYNMALIDPESIRSAQSVEDLDILETITVDMELEAGALTHGIDVCNMVSNTLNTEADPSRENPVHFIAKGDTEDMRVRFGSSLDSIDVERDTEAIYSLDYLGSLTAVIPSGTDVRTRFGQEMPIRMDYQYADGDGDVIIILAPRIDSV